MNILRYQKQPQSVVHSGRAATLYVCATTCSLSSCRETLPFSVTLSDPARSHPDCCIIAGVSRDGRTNSALVFTRFELAQHTGCQCPVRVDKQGGVRAAPGSAAARCLKRTLKDERLTAIGLCSPESSLLLSTPEYPPDLSCAQAETVSRQSPPRLVTEADHCMSASISFPSIRDRTPQLSFCMIWPLLSDAPCLSRQYFVIFIVSLGLVIALTTIVAAQLSWWTWIKGIRGILRGEDIARQPMSPPASRDCPLPLPQTFAPDCVIWRTNTVALMEQKTNWTAARLRSLLRTQLRGDQVIVVSNREPWVHERQGGQISAHQPASGLVTAVGAGHASLCRNLDCAWQRQRRPRNADAMAVLALPPDKPEYTCAACG